VKRLLTITILFLIYLVLATLSCRSLPEKVLTPGINEKKRETGQSEKTNTSVSILDLLKDNELKNLILEALENNSGIASAEAGFKTSQFSGKQHQSSFLPKDRIE